MTRTPGCDAILRGEDGIVGGDDGELCVHGPQRFDGYLDPADDEDRFVTLRRVAGTTAPGTGSAASTARSCTTAAWTTR